MATIFEDLERQQTGGSKAKVLAIITVLVVAPVLLWVAYWLYIHSMPTQADVRRAMEEADAVELIEVRDGQPVRTVALHDREQWLPLAQRIEFRERFWAFSDEPEDAIGIVTSRSGRRTLVMDVRDDASLHLRKGPRWYRMPIAPGFDEPIRELLGNAR